MTYSSHRSKMAFASDSGDFDSSVRRLSKMDSHAPTESQLSSEQTESHSQVVEIMACG